MKSAIGIHPLIAKLLMFLADVRVTTQPIETESGWIIVYREDSKSTTVPDFESIKKQIKADLEEQKIDNRIKTLNMESEIKCIKVESKPKQT